MQVRKMSASVFTELPDGTGVLLNLETLLYFSLNRTGAALWLEIDRTETVALESLVQYVCERFDVDLAAAQEEIARFAKRLAQLGLIQPF